MLSLGMFQPDLGDKSSERKSRGCARSGQCRWWGCSGHVLELRDGQANWSHSGNNALT